MKKRIIGGIITSVVMMLCVILYLPKAEAKTTPDGQTVGSMLFYVQNSAGEDILVSQIPVSVMAADLTAGTIDKTVYNYSVLDKLVTPVHQESQGMTVNQFIPYALNKTSVPALKSLSLTFNDNDKIGFWELDDQGGYDTDTYTYNDLYGATRYDYPLLYQYWDYGNQKYYDPNGVMNDAQVISYIQANAQETLVRLSVTAFSQRYIITNAKVDAEDYNMEYYWNSLGLLDTQRTVRLMMPMTADELANKISTADDSRYWVWNVLLNMESAPQVDSLGSVAAPTGYLTDDDTYYYVHFNCTTAGATVYYNQSYKSATYMPSEKYDPADPLKIAKTDLPNGTLTMTAHAVEDGYTDAGVVTLTLSSSESAPTVTAQTGYTTGQNVVLPISGDTVNYDDWASKLIVTVNSTQLTSAQFSVASSAVTINQAVFASAGNYTITLASGSYTTQTLQGVMVYMAAPSITAGLAYLGKALTFTYSDTGYQTSATVMVKSSTDTSFTSISTGTYLDRSVSGQLTILQSYFTSSDNKVTTAGTYTFRITNGAYWPQYQDVSVTFTNAPSCLAAAGNIAARAGDTISIPVTLSNNLGFAGFTFLVSYNSSVMTLSSVTQGTILTNGIFNANTTTNLISWASAVNTAAPGTLFTLNFTVNTGTSVADYTIGLSLRNGNVKNFCDSNGLAVNISFTPGTVSVYKLGDVNRDGYITSTDSVLLARFILGRTTPTAVQIIAADVNKDGYLTSVDRVKIARFLLGKITSF